MYSVQTVAVTPTEKRGRAEYAKYGKSKAGIVRPNSTAASKRSQHLLRVRALMALGGKCESCGISDMRVLHIDHIKNNGAQERKQFGRHHGMLKRVLSNPHDYQALCANCHEIKHTTTLR